MKKTEENDILENHCVGSNKKMNISILRLLETLTSLTQVSSQQNKQMEKMKASIKEKPKDISELWNQFEHKNKEAKEKINALSVKFDNCMYNLESNKENMRSMNEGNIQSKVYEHQNVTSVLSNISKKVYIVCSTYRVYKD